MPTAALTPGDAVVSQYVYVAGGWGDASPGTNLDVTQRYDMLTNTWTTGPALDSARAGPGAGRHGYGGLRPRRRQRRRRVLRRHRHRRAARREQLAERNVVGGGLAAAPVSSNNAGFCTDEILGTEVWNVAGANQSSFGITGRTFFRRADGEACATIRSDVPWLSVTPTSGDVAGDSSTPVTVSVDATGLADGEYKATLIVETTDPFAAELLVPVTLTVAGEPPPKPAAWVALEANGRIGGVQVTRSDVALVYDDGSVQMAFDGSEAGLPNRAHIDAVALAGEQYLLSFTEPVNVPGLGRVDDSDVVVYDGSAYGLWLDGSDFGLTTNDEDVDSLKVLDDGTIIVSVLGQGQVPGVGMRGEDLIALDTEDEWSMYFDGSDVGLTTSQELVDAAAVDAAGSLDLSTTGRLSAGGFAADDDDVAVFAPPPSWARTPRAASPGCSSTGPTSASPPTTSSPWRCPANAAGPGHRQLAVREHAPACSLTARCGRRTRRCRGP